MRIGPAQCSRWTGGAPGLAAALAATRSVLRSALRAVLWAACLTAVTGATTAASGNPHPKQNASMQAHSEAASQAIRRGQPESARGWVELGIDPAWQSPAGDTLLHEAVVFSGDAALVGALLRAGASVHAVNGAGDTPLVAALAQAHYQHAADGPRKLQAVLDLLLASGARLAVRDSANRPLLHLVLQWRRPALLHSLLLRGLELPDTGLLAALQAADEPQGLEVAILLLQHAQARHLAARDDEGRSPAHLAAERADRLPLLQQLAARGADLEALDATGATVFAAAALHDNLPALQWLAARGAASQQGDADGQTPLHRAAYEPRPQVLGWLLALGAERDARDRRGRRALDIAIATHRFAFRTPEEKLALVQLLGGGAQDIRRGRFSDHPLHQAIAARDARRVEALLAQGADANARNASGHPPLSTALSMAAFPAEREWGYRLLALLVRHGADARLTVTEHEDKTLTDLARELRLGDRLDQELRRQGGRH